MQSIRQDEEIKYITDSQALRLGLQNVEEELSYIVDQSDITIRDMIKTLFKSGKRLRPKLVFLSGMCFDDLNKHMIYSAVSAELIHTASLVHDDIIDVSDFRRNYPTINHLCGDHIAVLTGDFLFAHAFDILAFNNLNKSMSYLVNAIREMCVGEIMQAERKFNPDITENEYIDYIGRKTASLFSACCKAGAENAGANDDNICMMGIFGYDIGCAFQIIDDILDIIGSENELGKPVAHDILEGDINLPLIYLIEDKKYKDKYGELLLSKQIDSNQQENIMEDIKRSDALVRSRHKAEEFAEHAVNSLSTIPYSNYRNILIDMSAEIIDRRY